jgi:hypothetical protein
LAPWNGCRSRRGGAGLESMKLGLRALTSFYTRGIRVRGAVDARFPYRVGARRLVAVGGEGERGGEGGVDAEWRWESVALIRRGAVVEAEAASRVERWRRLAERRGRRADGRRGRAGGAVVVVEPAAEAGVTSEACGAALVGVQVVAFLLGEIVGGVDVVGRSGAVVGRGAVVESVGRRLVLIVVGVGGLGAVGEEMRAKAAGGANTTHLACPAALREGDLGVVLPAAKHALPTALLGREARRCTASGDMAGRAGILDERRLHVVEDGGGDGGGVERRRGGDDGVGPWEAVAVLRARSAVTDGAAMGSALMGKDERGRCGGVSRF